MTTDSELMSDEARVVLVITSSSSEIGVSSPKDSNLEMTAGLDSSRISLVVMNLGWSSEASDGCCVEGPAVELGRGCCKSGELADELMGAAPSEVDGEAVGSLLGDRLVEGELGMA